MATLQKELEKLQVKIQEVIDLHTTESGYDIKLEKIVFKATEKEPPESLADSGDKFRLWGCGFNHQGQWECKP